MSVKYVVRKSGLETAKGLYYASVVSDETIDLAGLAEHISSHNSVFDVGTTRGLLTQMSACIKEMLLEGYRVKIDDVVILSLSLRHTAGAESEGEFSVAKNVKGVRLCSRATGSLSNDALTAAATLKKVTWTTAASSTATSSTEETEQEDTEVSDSAEQETTSGGSGSVEA